MKIRRSTVLLLVIFVVTMVVYLLVRPVPDPVVRYLPVVPETPVAAETTTTVGPPHTDLSEVTDPAPAPRAPTTSWVGASTTAPTVTSTMIVNPTTPTSDPALPSTVVAPPTSG